VERAGVGARLLVGAEARGGRRRHLVDLESLQHPESVAVGERRVVLYGRRIEPRTLRQRHSPTNSFAVQ